MINHFCKTPLWQVSDKLAAVAQGRLAAETVIRGGRLVNVCTKEILPGVDLALYGGRIALVGDAGHCIGAATEVIEAAGQYLAPGFLDAHVHTESSMLSLGEYARAVIPHGTTGIYLDPHEIANVLGLAGVAWLAEDARRSPLKAMITISSCVPAVPGFEDNGATLGLAEIREALAWDNVVGLGEMMNFPGVLAGDQQVQAVIAAAHQAGKIVSGHYSLPETGAGLNAYIAAGIRSCHESTRAEDALAKLRLGMYALLREGSASRDLQRVIRAISEQNIDTRFAVLVSDDAHPHTLLEQGHMDHIGRRAIAEGVDPLTAIQMMTINAAQCFQMDQELGSLAPGKCADIVLLSDLQRLTVSRVLIDGQTVAREGRLTAEIKPYAYPPAALTSMQVGEEICPASFRFAAPGPMARVRVIEVADQTISTKAGEALLPVRQGEILLDPAQDILKAVVFERHRATGSKGCGFVHGFGIRQGAMASTVAHDAHNLLVVGSDDADMALAAQTLVDCGGGQVVVRDGRVLGLVPLPIAGLINDRSAAEMSALVAELEQAWRQLGCTVAAPFMVMAMISLACIPELRLTNRGLVDCRSFNFVPLLLAEDDGAKAF